MVHALENTKTGLSLKMFPALVLCDSVFCRNAKHCKGIISTCERGDALRNKGVSTDWIRV